MTVFNRFTKTIDDFNEAIDIVNLVNAINNLSSKVTYLLERHNDNRHDQQNLSASQSF